MPVGPSILWPVNAMKSAPSSATSIGRCGTDCEQSSITSAPTSCARATIRETLLIVPRMFDMCTIETSFVRSLTRSCRPDSSSLPSSVTPNQRSVAPVRWHNNCHGTRLEWCSISETTISSPGPRDRNSADVYASRLIASDEFFVNTTSSGDDAPMNAATLARAPSYAVVASVPSVCTERDTLALCHSY
jgi:hypothetical protein